MTQFTAVADIHYSDRERTGDKLNSLSLPKMREVVMRETGKPGFIMNLGDTADGYEDYRPQLELLQEIKDMFDETGRKSFSVIGNHDTSSDKHDYFKILDMPGRYYTFDAGDYMGLVFDAAMNDKNKPFPDSEMIWYEPYIDDEQADWIEKTINESEKKVLVFSHFPLIVPDPDKDLINDPSQNHRIINRDRLLRFIRESDKVRACFSGHYHMGTVMLLNGKPFVTFRGMAIGEECTYANVEIDEEKLTVTGFGRQESFTIYNKLK